MNVRLLLVDDDPDLELIVSVLARRCGHTLRQVQDGQSAWSALTHEQFDLVLLDVNLPDVRGPELLRRCRADAGVARRTAGRVALFCQANLDADVADGWAAGADFLVSKELIVHPELWRQRLGEIVAHVRGRNSGSSLCWTLPDVLAVDPMSVDRVLRLPVFSSMPRELFRQVALRARRAADLPDYENAPCGIATDPRVTFQVGLSRAATGDRRRALQSLIDQVRSLHGRAAVDPIEGCLRDTSENQGTQRSV